MNEESKDEESKFEWKDAGQVLVIGFCLGIGIILGETLFHFIADVVSHYN